MKRDIRSLIIIFSALVCSSASVFSQTYTLNNTLNGTTVNTCSGTFYDSGGAGGNDTNNKDRQVTPYSLLLALLIFIKSHYR